MKNKNSFFITFEGGEKAGKGTQAKILAERLKEDGYNVLLTHEPGGSKLGQIIRGEILRKKLSPEAELFLFEAGRAVHMKDVIIPALNKGIIVISDRFFDSTTVYQGYARGLPIEFVRKTNAVATFNLKPNLTILLDSDYETLALRLKTANDINRFEKESHRFHEKVFDGFRILARKEWRRFFIVDGRKPIEEISEIIWKKILERLKR